MYKTFDEHINYLNEKIKENCDCIEDLKDENKQLLEELEETEKSKEAFNENNYEPTIYLTGWKDTEEKKKEVLDWCKQHELLFHSEIIGDFVKGYRLLTAHHKERPEYEFITASSDTSKIRFVRCLNCFKKSLLNEKTERESYEHYLKDY